MSLTLRNKYGDVQSESVIAHASPRLPFLNPFTVNKVWGEPLLKSDYITPNSQGSHREWKSFEHYKLEVQNTPSMTGIPVDVAHDIVLGGTCMFQSPYALCPSYYGELGRPNAGLDNFWDPLEGIPTPNGLGSLIQRGLSSTLPLIKSELSLINTIVELKDVESLTKTLLSIRKFLAKSLFDLNSRFTLREFFHTTADGYLQAKFNILPLLSDISGVKAACRKYEKRINALVANQGRPQVKHFNVSLLEFKDTINETLGFVNVDAGLPYPHSLAEAALYRTTNYQPTIFHSEIEYNYNYTRYQQEHALVLGLLDALGVNLNPQIIWNAIPWSFVVDWVAKVGNFLSQFQMRNLEPVINIRRCLWSVLRERDIHVDKVVRLNFTEDHDAQRTKTQLPIVKETAYRRTVFMPDSSSIALSGLSSTEFTLGAALVLSRRRGRH
jgi:hypothetical protein